MIRIFLTGAGLGIIGLMLWLAGIMFLHPQTTSQVFDIELEIHGNYIDDSIVIQTIDSQVDPLRFFLHPEDLETALAAHPSIEKSVVRWSFPNILKIRIESVRPVARVFIHQQAIVIDASGAALICSHPLIEDLPCFQLIPNPEDIDFMHPGSSLEAAFRLAAYLISRDTVFWADYRMMDARVTGEISLIDQQHLHRIRLSLMHPVEHLAQFADYAAKSPHSLLPLIDLRFPGYMVLRNDQPEVSHG